MNFIDPFKPRDLVRRVEGLFALVTMDTSGL